MKGLRKYRAVVVDVKKAAITGIAVLPGVVVAALLLFAFRSALITDDGNAKIDEAVICSVSEESLAERAGRYTKHGVEFAVKTILGYIPTSEKSILCGSVSAYKNISKKRDVILGGSEVVKNLRESSDVNEIKGESGKNEEKSLGETENEIREENRGEIKVIDASRQVSDGVAVGNETSYSVDIQEMMTQTPKINMDAEGPKILITHTHATESYADSGARYYDITASDRTEDTSRNVVAVGKRLKEVFEENGIETLHDTVLHDVPSFNGSYAHSLNTVTEYMEKYPSIQIVLDVHRDSIVYDDNTKAKILTKADGKDAAQLMLVVGTDERGLYNPDWRDNMNAAVKFQMAVTQKYPKLMRHINLRQERFNGHTSHASMIIEAGSSGNSLEEVLTSIELAGECIAEYLNSL